MIAVGSTGAPNLLGEIYDMLGDLEEHSGEGGWTSWGLARLCADYKQVRDFDVYMTSEWSWGPLQ